MVGGSVEMAEGCKGGCIEIVGGGIGMVLGCTQMVEGCREIV